MQRHGGGLFWRLFNRLSDTKVPANVLTERLMTQAYVRALLSLGDRNVFMAGMMAEGADHQPQVPGPPLNGPTISSVIQPP